MPTDTGTIQYIVFPTHSNFFRIYFFREPCSSIFALNVCSRYLQIMTQISSKTNSMEVISVMVTVMFPSNLIGQGAKSSIVSNVIGSTIVCQVCQLHRGIGLPVSGRAIAGSSVKPEGSEVGRRYFYLKDSNERHWEVLSYYRQFCRDFDMATK